ncbi:MAG: DUF2202 domain-containing protein [Gammaproteobacteria bacterium]
MTTRKNTMNYAASLLLLALLLSGESFAQQVQNDSVLAVCQLTADQIQSRTLSEQEADTLLFMREEEKMARDVYLELFDQWGSQVFENIEASEQQHMDRIKVFLDAYGLTDPALPEPGQFNNTSLQALYDELTAKGSVSVLEAYKVGALIEEIDIQDLRDANAATDVVELQTMYGQLLEASYNHLRAFARQIILAEGSYSAQVLSDDDVAVILASADTVVMYGNGGQIDQNGRFTAHREQCLFYRGGQRQPSERSKWRYSEQWRACQTRAQNFGQSRRFESTCGMVNGRRFPGRKRRNSVLCP